MKMQEFQVRQANEADIEAIAQIIDQIKQGMEQPDWFVASDRTYVEQHISAQGFTVVAETLQRNNDVIAAAFVVDFPGDTEENLGLELALDQGDRMKVAHMDTAVVLPEYRGHHLQGRLLEAAERETARQGMKYLMCTIHPENRYSLNSMMSHGYRIIGTKGMYGGFLRHILYKPAGQEAADQKTNDQEATCQETTGQIIPGYETTSQQLARPEMKGKKVSGAPVVLVSACLLGVCCRYNGGGVLEEQLQAMMPAIALIPVCPEIKGGLPTPREPAERVGERILTRSGIDVTAEYEKGAGEVLRLAKLYGCTCAILKERSPSCGSGIIYDGTHTQKLTNGDGVTAELLRRNGIRIFGESNIDELKDFMADI